MLVGECKRPKFFNSSVIEYINFSEHYFQMLKTILMEVGGTVLNALIAFGSENKINLI